MALHGAEVTVCLGGMGMSRIGGAGRQSTWDTSQAQQNPLTGIDDPAHCHDGAILHIGDPAHR